MANEAYDIDNAGLVLLAVYLPQLFGQLGLTRNHAFVDQAARHSAVHCLAYLGDEHVVPDEPTLVLNRLLCGMRVDEDVPSATPPEASRPVQDSLLPAVVANWPALG